MTQGLRIQLLGAYTVWVGEQRIQEAAWRLRKAKHLVKLLALTPGHRLHREQVTEWLWENFESDSATNNFHQILYVARRTLASTGGDPLRFLHLREDVVSLCQDESLWIDVEAFGCAAGQAHQTKELADYQTAIRLYTGDLLPQDLYEEWTISHRENLRRTHISLLGELAGLHETRQEYSLALQTFSKILDVEPLDEAAHRALMRLCALTGQRQRALRQYQLLQETLAVELDTEPDQESQQLYRDILTYGFPPPGIPSGPALGSSMEPDGDGGLETRPVAPARIPPNNLPIPLTNFIGRESEIARVKYLIDKTRLLTLTGAGGSGKTRLALEIANEVLEDYPDGIFVVQLADLHDPGLVPHTTALALRISEEPHHSVITTLAEHLKSREMMLILDNCEHLTEECANLAETLLTSCPKLRVVATSRERLGILGETVWQVPPLSTPSLNSQTSVSSLLHYDAITLFVDRASLIQPSFELTAKNCPGVGRICHRLDGIPLAIEMAAARVNVLSVDQINERLDESYRLLTNGNRGALLRHKTLQSVVDWSYGLLREPEQSVFNRLSVFTGGFTLEAAELVCYSDYRNREEVLDILFHLVDKSLVLVEEGLGGAVRYRLLEILRQYGQGQLENCGEIGATRGRHLSYFLELAEKGEPKLRGRDQSEWLEIFDKEHDNLRAALRWAGVSELEDAAPRLAGALWRFWLIRGYFSEGREWLETMLEKHNFSSMQTRAKILNGAAVLACTQCDYSRAVVLLDDSLALLRKLGDKGGIANSLNNLGAVVWAQGDYQRATTLRQESLALWSELEDRQGVASLLNNLGLMARDQGEFSQAKAFLEESLELRQRLGDHDGIGLCLYNLGLVSQFQGDYTKAGKLVAEGLCQFRSLEDKAGIALCLCALGVVSQYQGDFSNASDLLTESLTLFKELGDKVGIAECLEGMAGLASQVGQLARAARILAIADQLRSAVGAPLTPACRVEIEQNMSRLQTALGMSLFDVEWNQGRALTLEEAIQYASQLETFA